MFEEQNTISNPFDSEVSSTQTIPTFTFYSSDTLFALKLEHVLSVNDDLDQIQTLPIKGQGILGVYKYQNSMVPIFDFAKLIGVDSGQVVMQSLIENLELREKEHVDWLDALNQSLEDENIAFTKALDPHKCAFGKWYDGFETRDETLRDILVQFDVPHKHIHSLANKLFALRDQGKQAEALDCLHIERHGTLRRLESLFSQACEQVKSAMRPVILFVTKDGVVPTFGIIVDEINDVIEYNADAIQSDIGINSHSENSNLFSGMYVGEDGVDSIICNVDDIVPR